MGVYLSIRTFIQIGCMFLYPPLQRHRWIGRDSPVRVYQLGMTIWPITVMCYPFLNLLARVDQLGSTQGWVFKCSMMLFFIVWGLGGYCWTSVITISIKQCVIADAIFVETGPWPSSQLMRHHHPTRSLLSMACCR